MKSKIKFKKLNKTGGARLLDVNTILLESSDESVIVKIHDANSFFINRENTALERLKHFENSVQMICHFSCIDEKERWNNIVSTNSSPVTFCNNKKDPLYFIVLEYIKNGSVEEFFHKNPPIEIISSFFMQLMLSIMVLGFEYKISHGDIHSGNVLIYHTDKKQMTYKFLGKRYLIQTYGFYPVFIDYGRCSFYREIDINPEYVLEDIYTAFTIFSNFIESEIIKVAFRNFIIEQSATLHQTPENLLFKTRLFFKTFTF